MKWSNLSPLRIALLDDHALIRSGFRARLSGESDFELIATYASSRELLASMRISTFDVLILDYTLRQGELDGLNLIKLLRVRHPDVRILLYSASESPAIISLAVRAGASGFVGKSEDVNEIVSAIRRVASERMHLPKSVERELGYKLPVQDAVSAIGEAPPPGTMLMEHPYLSPREYEVLRCCLDGMSVSQIALKFSRSRKTISGQKQSAFRKLGIRCDAELFKVQSGLEVG